MVVVLIVSPVRRRELVGLVWGLVRRRLLNQEGLEYKKERKSKENTIYASFKLIIKK